MLKIYILPATLHKDPDLMYDYIMLQEYINSDPKKTCLSQKTFARQKKNIQIVSVILKDLTK